MEDFFFTGPLDYLLYEAELAQGSRKPITLDIRRRPVETPGETTWTGFGFKQVFEGSDITFRIPLIYRYRAHTAWRLSSAEISFVSGYKDQEVQLGLELTIQNLATPFLKFQ